MQWHYDKRFVLIRRMLVWTWPKKHEQSKIKWIILNLFFNIEICFLITVAPHILSMDKFLNLVYRTKVGPALWAPFWNISHRDYKENLLMMHHRWFPEVRSFWGLFECCMQVCNAVSNIIIQHGSFYVTFYHPFQVV